MTDVSTEPQDSPTAEQVIIDALVDEYEYVPGWEAVAVGAADIASHVLTALRKAGRLVDPNATETEIEWAYREVERLTRERDHALALLADVVVKAAEFGEQDGGFVAHYLLPTGPLHRAIPHLDQYGITVRPGSSGGRRPVSARTDGLMSAQPDTPDREQRLAEIRGNLADILTFSDADHRATDGWAAAYERDVLWLDTELERVRRERDDLVRSYDAALRATGDPQTGPSASDGIAGVTHDEVDELHG